MKIPKYMKIIFYIVTTIVVIIIIGRLNESLITISLILFFTYVICIQKAESDYYCCGCRSEINKDDHLKFYKYCKDCFNAKYHKIDGDRK